MSLLGLLDRALIGRAESSALEFEDAAGRLTTFTFGDLERRSNALAQQLIARGVGRGDRLAFYLANQPFIIELWLACIKLGVIVVPINVLYREREIAHIVHDAAPCAVISEAAQASLLPTDVAWWDVAELMREAAGAATGRTPALSAMGLDAETPMALVYTSGTTGASKGAVLTHGNFAANGLALVHAWGGSSTTRRPPGLRRTAPRSSSACRPCTCACSSSLPRWRAPLVSPCACSCRGRRRCRRRC